MSLNTNMPAIFTAPFRAVAPAGGMMYVYEKGDIVKDPAVLVALSGLGAPLVNVSD